MKAKPRTLYIDNQTYETLHALAERKKISRSSLVRILINEQFDQGQGGIVQRRAPPTKKLDSDNLFQPD
jgi:hypothetical protein